MGPRVSTRSKGKPSIQEVGTPMDFIAAVTAKFGEIGLDLAASAENHKADFWLGPGSPLKQEDALVVPWHRVLAHPAFHHGLAWLNPPFHDIAPWAEKCAAEMNEGAEILLLSPASTDTNWFRDHVAPHADIYLLNGRIKFIGHKTPYPKGLMLAHYTQSGRSMTIWEWKKGKEHSVWTWGDGE